MNPVVRGQLRRFSESYSINKLDESDQFELYSIFCVVNGLMSESIDPFEVHLRGHEFGLDGVAILLQGEIVKNATEARDKIQNIKNPEVEFVFFQSKKSQGFDYGNISKFFDSIANFFDSIKDDSSEQLNDLIDCMEFIYENAIGRKNPTVKAFYITTGNYDKQKKIEQKKDSFVREMEKRNIFHKNGISVDFCGARQLQEWYRVATTAVSVEISFSESVVMPNIEGVEEGYIGYLEACELIKLFSNKDQFGNLISVNKSVFFDNIRDYNEDSEINKGIIDSAIESKGKDFLFKNNGVTVVSKAIDRTGNKFRVEDFQIVNGCQTSNIIFFLSTSDDIQENVRNEIINNISVPFRLIGSKDDEFVGSIIIGTNRQNPVKEDQFWALRPFMKSFEEFSQAVNEDEIIFFERRENQYKGQDVERVRIVQPAEMMKAVAATVLRQPHRAGRDYRGITEEYEDRLFLDDHDVRIYHAVCFLHYRLEFLWRNQRISASLKKYRYYILYAAGVLIIQKPDILTSNSRTIETAAKNIKAFARDEAAFIALAAKVEQIIVDKLDSAEELSTSQIRDRIRTDAFAAAFLDAIDGVRIPEIDAYIER